VFVGTGGEGGEGKTQDVHGTGMGEGDTTGAKDVSDKLDNEDQLLGAQQKDKPEEQQQQQQQPEDKGPDNDDKVSGQLLPPLPSLRAEVRTQEPGARPSCCIG
jgi:midasin